MHELSIAMNLLDQVVAINEEHSGKSVDKIIIEVGQLTGIVPKLLYNCFKELAKGTVAADAELVIEKKSPLYYCPSCGREEVSEEFLADNLTCIFCKVERQIIGGDELILRNLEVEIDEGGYTSTEELVTE